ncbi:hypothetical protein GXW82_22750 [Streptacidiphilus sp. 4-A2]|nr:hypothetical protein [Streptacidiphilus sp. 4-A2]
MSDWEIEASGFTAVEMFCTPRPSPPPTLPSSPLPREGRASGSSSPTATAAAAIR